MTGAELEFWVGERYYVNDAGANGMYFPTEGESVIDAWRTPEKFKLSVKPLARFRELGEPAIWYAISGWIEEWFHVVDIKSKKSDNTFKSRELCKGVTCDYCKDKVEKVFGKKVYIPFSASQWSAMWVANEVAHSRCQCGGIVYTSHYICEECAEPIYDFANACFSCESEDLTIDEDKEEFCCNSCSTSWSIYPFNNAELYKEVTAETKCGACGHTAVPQPVRYCTECEADFEDLGILDYQVKISAKSQGKGKAKIVTIKDFIAQEPDARLFDPKYQANDPEWGEKIAKGNKTPLDLTKECAPFTQDKECELLKVGNPFDMGEGGDNYRNYSRNDDGSEDSGEDQDGEDSSEEEESKPARRVGKGPKKSKGAKAKKRGKPSFARRPGR